MDYSDKTIKELQETLKDIKAEIAKKKSENLRQKKSQVPDNIIKTPEYGWVKVLPVGPGEDVYTWEIRYVSMYGKIRVSAAVTSTNKAKWFCECGRQKEEWTKPVIKIIKMPMRVSYYGHFGKKIFLEENEARQAMINWLGESYTGEEISELWVIEE